MKQGYIEGLAHIGIFCSDLEKSKDFYTKLLDFQVIHENQLNNVAGITKIAFLNNGGLTIELLQPPKERFESKKETSGLVLDHLAINVKNIETVVDKLKKKGLVFDTEEIQYLGTFWEHGTKFINFKGPDGEKLELSEVL